MYVRLHTYLWILFSHVMQLILLYIIEKRVTQNKLDIMIFGTFPRKNCFEKETNNFLANLPAATNEMFFPENSWKFYNIL